MVAQPNAHPSPCVALVTRLHNDRSSDARADTAKGIGDLLSSEALSEAERQLAVEIVEVLARDVQQQVREAVARSVAHCTLLPPNIARQLAEDVEAVALPILKASDVLSDGDLVELVRHGNLAKQRAIAQRSVVRPPVSDALIGTGHETVVETLLQNQGSQIGEGALNDILDGFAGSPAIQSAMVQRFHLPLAVVDRLVQVISSELRAHLIAHHHLPAELVEAMMRQGQEGALTRIVRKERRAQQIELLVFRLDSQHKLSATLVLRTLLEGDLHFFEAAIACLARTPTHETRTLLYHSSPSALQRFYVRTGLPKTLFAAFRIALDVVKQVRSESEESDQAHWSPTVTNQIVNRLICTYREVCPSDLEAVLNQLSRYTAAA